MIYMFGCKSKSKRLIAKELNIVHLRDIREAKKTDVVINYGANVSDVMCRAHIINRNIGFSKYTAIKRVASCDIKTPKSCKILMPWQKPSDFIEKRLHSSKGYGIKQATTRSGVTGKYYQEFIKDRAFELRVHAFIWLPSKTWTVNKRVGDKDKIAWNFSQGGHFRNSSKVSPSIISEARNIASKVLEKLKLSFGAVDLIVTTTGDIYFIEVNSAPGFTEFNEGTYLKAFSELKNIPFDKLSCLC